MRRPRFRIDVGAGNVLVNFAHEDFNDADRFQRWFAWESRPLFARFLREACTPRTLAMMEGEIRMLLDRAIAMRKLYLGWDNLWRLDFEDVTLD